MYRGALTVLLLFCFLGLSAQNLQLALLEYSGGGDWYANPTALKNLAAYANKVMGTQISTQHAEVESGSPSIFSYPFVHMTGHGRVDFTPSEASNMRAYLESGGFLHIDDNYGMNEWLRPAMKKVLPKAEFVEVPYSHPIYHGVYDFPSGLPKIHQHDGKGPMGYGIFIEDRLAVFYSYESDLGDGWEDPEVHQDPPEIRQKALQMGVNILYYAMMY